MGPLFFPLLICIALAFSQTSSQETQCKENYQKFKDSCYSLSPDTDTWGNAQKKCASQGGNLVTIQNEEENDFVMGLFQNTESLGVWIGGYEHRNTKNWKWIDGQPMQFLNWDAGQPREYPDKVTMMLFPSGKWGNEVPSQKFLYVCEHVSVPTCDAGYFLYNSHCYSYREQELGFHQAQKNCSDDGGNLASVHSPTEDCFLKILTGNNYAWIGGKIDPENDGLWNWTDKTPFNYKQWADYQPAKNPDNDCILMNYLGSHFGTGWANELCDIAYGYICKKPQRQAL